MYLEDDQYIVNGGICIMDLKGTGMAHIAEFTPVMLKTMIIASEVRTLI